MIIELSQNLWFSFLSPDSIADCHSPGAKSELGLSFVAIWIRATIFLLDKSHSLELCGPLRV